MKKYFSLPLLFVLTGILFFLATFFFYRSPSQDILTGAAYFAVDPLLMALVPLVLLLFFALVYFLFHKSRRPLIQVLGVLHYSLSALTVLLFVALPALTINRIDSQQSFGICISIITWLFLLAQLVFLANIIIVLLRKRI